LVPYSAKSGKKEIDFKDKIFGYARARKRKFFSKPTAVIMSLITVIDDNFDLNTYLYKKYYTITKEKKLM